LSAPEPPAVAALALVALSCTGRGAGQVVGCDDVDTMREKVFRVPFCNPFPGRRATRNNIGIAMHLAAPT